MPLRLGVGCFLTAKGVRPLKSLGIVGTGRVGAALAYAFSRAGLPLDAVASRDSQKAQALATTIGQAGYRRPQAVASEDITRWADVVIIATPDDTIAAMCALIPWDNTKLAVHCSGAQTLEVLRPASWQGASVGSFHPLNSFARSDLACPGELDEKAGVLKNSYIGIAASDAPSVELLRLLANTTGAGHFSIAEEDRVLYHVAAVFAANFIHTLLATSLGLWRDMGCDTADALRFLGPLLQTASHNALVLGPVSALTGPIARGDSGTVQRHLAALDDLAGNPDTAALYRSLAKATLPLALAKGTLDATRYNEILTLLQREDKNHA